jgi:excinuclease UvrABC helicase subunit UvrB
MLRKRLNFNNFFSDLDSLFDDFSSPFVLRGKRDVQTGDDENGQWTKETFISEDGSYQMTTIVHHINQKTKGSPNEKSNLQKDLQQAVEKQDFEQAAKLRDQIKQIEVNKEKIEEIQSKLNEAVKKQDYELAIKYRDDLKKLKS